MNNKIEIKNKIYIIINIIFYEKEKETSFI